MINIDATNDSRANNLCKACGLCCTGHLFIWAKLRPAELDPAEALGMNVFRSDPSQRGFSQPCPLWKGQCTIYASSHYPHVCRSYKCKLLKEVLGEHSSLPDALTIVQQAKDMIHELESLLPISPKVNFRERLVAYLESSDHRKASAGQQSTNLDLRRQKAGALLIFYEKVLGVEDLVEKPDED